LGKFLSNHSWLAKDYIALAELIGKLQVCQVGLLDEVSIFFDFRGEDEKFGHIAIIFGLSDLLIL